MFKWYDFKIHLYVKLFFFGSVQKFRIFLKMSEFFSKFKKKSIKFSNFANKISTKFPLNSNNFKIPQNPWFPNTPHIIFCRFFFKKISLSEWKFNFHIYILCENYQRRKTHFFPPFQENWENLFFNRKNKQSV